MIVPILILVLSIIFISSLISPKKLLLHVKKPFLSSSTSPLQPISSPKENTKDMMMNKDDDDDLKQVFDTFDKNGDGFITKEELKESLNNMGMIVPTKDVEELVEKLDSNKDGFVDLGEFRELYYELVKGKKEKKNEEEKKVNDFDYDDEEDLKEAFNVFDGNNDGLITKEELGLVLSSLGLKEGSYMEEDCKEMIKKVDVDGDGMVNFDEFKIMMKSRCNTKTSKVVHGI
ncbi:calmodulin-like protein 3 [Chenopodium quinoa]|uniref:calmodulin-like protein 3 n=1 Tax=Chenopodium quinoa TaxID=63459 RepID=UPI000B776340|nr:calmodulin-like protein 3 [Chenopodium quinoa]